jgi:hypothetical protein
VSQILVLNSQSVDFSGMANPRAKGRIENLKPFKKAVSGNPGGRRKPRKPEEVIEAALDETQLVIIEDLREAAKRLTGKAWRLRGENARHSGTVPDNLPRQTEPSA